MTIAICCNLSDGVILGADSAISVEGGVELPGGIQQKGILKVYKSSQKLFQLSSHVGISAFGLGMIGSRSIGSYINEFKLKHKEEIQNSEFLQDICENLRKFFEDKYLEGIKPGLEKRFGKSLDSIPKTVVPKLGFHVAGYSKESPLSEVWVVSIPDHSRKEDLLQLRAPGKFGSNWSGIIDPLTRLIKGYDRNLVQSLVDLFLKKCDIKFDEELKKEIDNVLRPFEGRILYDAMPLQEGIDHVKYLLDVVIHNTRFVIGAPICDAPISIAVIKRDSGFDYVEEPKFRINI